MSREDDLSNALSLTFERNQGSGVESQPSHSARISAMRSGDTCVPVISRYFFRAACWAAVAFLVDARFFLGWPFLPFTRFTMKTI